jgi:protease-4
MKSFIKNVLSTVVGMLIASTVTVLVFAAFIALLIQGAGRGASASIERDSILRLKLRGEIVDKHRPLDFNIFGNLGPGSLFKEDRKMGLWEITRAIEAAKKDDRIDGIYLELRDFSAGWATLTALHDKLEDFRKSSKKWVYAYGDTYSTKAYYLATSADRIFIQPYGELEFQGLSLTEPFVKGLLDKLEVEPKIFRVGKFKAATEPLFLEKMSPENRKQNDDLLGDIWSIVRKATAQSQKLVETRVDEIAAGLLAVSAADAKKVGLVTDTAFQDEVEDAMRDMTIYKDRKPNDKNGDDDELRYVGIGQLLKDSRTRAVLRGKGKNKIAVIFAEGEIGSGEGGRDSIGSETFREDLADAREDEDVQAIVVRINSPGGDALASDVIWREMMITDEEVPVVISMGDVAASGGYYMASAGRYIFAEPTTITGSIGVFGLMFNTQKFFKNKLATNFDRVTTHPYSDIGDGTRPMTAFEANQIQSQVERTYKRFLDVVQEGRGYEKRSDLESIAEGRVWSGKRALDLGLVDEMGGMEEALKKAAEYASITDYTIEIFPSDSDPLMQLLERFSGDTVESLLGPAVLSRLKMLEAIAPKVSMPKPGIYTRLLRAPEIR